MGNAVNQSNHAFKDFDQSLQEMERLLHETIQKIIEMNSLNVDALAQFSNKEAVMQILRAARALDKEINQHEFAIVAAIQNILGKYNPRGRDLRFIIGSVKLSTLLESVADKIKNNIKRIHKTEKLPAAEVIAKLQEMLNISAEVMKIISALLNKFEMDASDEVNRRRRKIEALYREVWVQETSVDATYHNIVMLAKNIERNADIVSDVKKIIYFMETGEKLVKKKKVETTGS